MKFSNVCVKFTSVCIKVIHAGIYVNVVNEYVVLCIIDYVMFSVDKCLEVDEMCSIDFIGESIKKPKFPKLFYTFKIYVCKCMHMHTLYIVFIILNWFFN